MLSMIFQMSYGIAQSSMRDHVGYMEESPIGYPLLDKSTFQFKRKYRPMAYQLELMPSTISRKSFDIAQCSRHDRADYMEESQIDCP